MFEVFSAFMIGGMMMSAASHSHTVVVHEPCHRVVTVEHEYPCCDGHSYVYTEHRHYKRKKRRVVRHCYPHHCYRPHHYVIIH